MRTGNKITLLFLFALAGITCKKETLKPGSSFGSTVFYFNGYVSGAPENFNAGAGNYYMYSSYSQGADSIYSFMGSLHQTNGTNNSIEFIINDSKTTAPGVASNINSSLVLGSYIYQSDSAAGPTGYSVTFTPVIGNGTPTNYSYNFGDGGTYSGPTGIQTHIYNGIGTYTTTLNVTFSGGSPDTITGVVQPGSAIVLNTNLFILKNDTTNRTVIFKDFPVSGGTGPYTITWTYGDGNMFNGPYNIINDSETHTYPFVGPYHVSAKIKDAVGNTCTNTIGFYTKDTSNSATPNYISKLNASAPVLILPGNKIFSQVTVIYTDGSGDVYSSANIGAQPGTSNFHITSISNYQNNENNQATKMVHITFACQVKDAVGKVMPINGDAAIAVAYK